MVLYKFGLIFKAIYGSINPMPPSFIEVEHNYSAFVQLIPNYRYTSAINKVITLQC